jgi:hypothetical protein
MSALSTSRSAWVTSAWRRFLSSVRGGSRIQEGLDEPRKTFQNRLSQARTVLAHSSDLAQAVLAGSKFLDAAYDEANQSGPRRREGAPIGHSVSASRQGLLTFDRRYCERS